MSASAVRSGSAGGDFDLQFTCGAHAASLGMDPNIDDPVNDTGRGPRRGDLQLSDEFACLLSMICEGRGEFS